MHARRPIRLITLLVFLIAPALASLSAQTSIPIPPAPAPLVISRPPALDEPATRLSVQWSGRAEVSYVATRGNADTTTAQLGAEAQYKPGDWAALFRGAFLTSTNADDTHNRRIDGLVRTSRTVNPRLELFGQIAYLRNTFAGLSHSVYPLAGVAYAVVDGTPHRLTTRIGFGYGQENRIRSRDLRFATADAEAAYRWAMSATAELRQETTFTANLSRAADWRIANVTSVASALNAALKLKVSHSINYLHEPVAGFERVDTITSAAVVATF